MLPSGKRSHISEIYERLGELIKAPKSFGLTEHLPARFLAMLTSTREILMEQMAEQTNDGTRIPTADDDLAAELSQDADTKHCLLEGEQSRSFNRLLCLRMEQLHLSPHDVAVSLGSTIQYVSDLRGAAKLPTEQRIAELALLLGVTRENLRTAVQQQISGMVATV